MIVMSMEVSRNYEDTRVFTCQINCNYDELEYIRTHCNLSSGKFVNTTTNFNSLRYMECEIVCEGYECDNLIRAINHLEPNITGFPKYPFGPVDEKLKQVEPVVEEQQLEISTQRQFSNLILDD